MGKKQVVAGKSYKRNSENILELLDTRKVSMFSYLILPWPAVGLLAALPRGASVKIQNERD